MKSQQDLRIAIIGSKSFKEMELISSLIRELPIDTQINVGDWPGLEKHAHQCAIDNGLKVEIFKTDWKAHGQMAGKVRMDTLFAASDVVVAFVDPTGTNSLDAVEQAKQSGKRVIVCQMKGGNPEISEFQDGKACPHQGSLIFA